jgi:hypothetical protein
MDGQRIDQRTESQIFGSLRHAREEHARRGRHAEGRKVVLGQVIGVEAGRIIGLRHAQPMLVVLGERQVVAIEMIENPKMHISLF